MSQLAYRVLGCVLLAGAGAWAQTTRQLEAELTAIGVTERLGATVELEAVFTDDRGEPARLREHLGRPVLLTFNYTSCPVLCGLQLSGLAKAMKELGWPGEGAFDLVTVSVNPQESLPQLVRYKQSMVRLAGGTDEAARGWRFLIGTEGSIRALADSVGFRYRFDPETKEFRHQATVVVLTPEGRVSGYLHGVAFPRDNLTGALERASRGAIATVEQQAAQGGFLMSCIRFFSGDALPLGLRVMRVAGAVLLLFLVVFIGVFGGRELRRRRLDRESEQRA